MKKLTLTLLLLFSLNAKAVFWIEIVNPCVNAASIFEEVDVFLPASVADTVDFFFPAFDIPYEASETSMLHIFNTPTGKDAVEWISDTNYRIYGWCYEVDGVIPDVTMDQYFVDPIRTEKVRWFYGFAEHKDGQWLNYCEPLYKHPDQFICAGLLN